MDNPWVLTTHRLPLPSLARLPAALAGVAGLTDMVTVMALAVTLSACTILHWVCWPQRCVLGSGSFKRPGSSPQRRMVYKTLQTTQSMALYGPQGPGLNLSFDTVAMHRPVLHACFMVVTLSCSMSCVLLAQTVFPR